MAISKIQFGGQTEDVKDSRLPDVSSADNGKVLAVVSGAWSAEPNFRKIYISSSEPSSSDGSNGDIWIVV